MKLLPLALIVILTALLIAACGDDDGGPSPTPVPSVEAGGLFPRHLTAIKPEHLSSVTNADIHVGETDATDGICASFDFRAGETMGDDPTSRVTLTVNEEPVTDSGNWVVTDDLPTSSGTLCYPPPVALEGQQTVVVRWADATDRQFVYSWQFSVAD